MIGWLRAVARAWSSPEREARTLNRDAASIIEDTRESYRLELVRSIALRTREEIHAYEAAVALAPRRADDMMRQLRSRHRDARRRYEPAALTACTLAIIYLRAERIGSPAAPAREAVRTFLAEWAHDAEPPDP